MSRRVFLEELFVPDENKHGPINIDLVLIHGVDGDSVQTWKDVDSGMIWPVDLIPQCQPRTRVLSFAYNGDMYRNDCAASIRDNARSLLSFLMTKRKRVGPERRIVFVAHCLGGLIAKHALYVSEFEKEFRAIKAATDGVLFFGTPHQGTHRDEWDRIGKAFSPLDKVTRGRRSPLVDAMKRSSHALADINDKFRQIAVNYDITSFYETGLWPGTSKLIVDKTAGVMMIPHEKRVHIDAHHRAMCTFSSVKDPIFETMCDRILQATEVEEESETEEASEANDAGVPGTMAAFTYPASTAAPVSTRSAIAAPRKTITTTTTTAAILTTTTMVVSRDAQTTLDSGHTGIWHHDVGGEVSMSQEYTNPRGLPSGFSRKTLPAPSALQSGFSRGLRNLFRGNSTRGRDVIEVAGPENGHGR